VLFVFRKKKIVGVIFADLSFSLLPRSGQKTRLSILYRPEVGSWAGFWLLGRRHLASLAEASGVFGGGISPLGWWHLALDGGVWLSVALASGSVALASWPFGTGSWSFALAPYPAALALSPSALALSPSTLALCPLHWLFALLALGSWAVDDVRGLIPARKGFV
jgi:hypothetical protein